MEKKMQSSCWWFESDNTSSFSHWLLSTILELNEKTKTMLKLIEDDAESMEERAEMHCTTRPKLIRMVKDLYQAHRSLAERYDQLKNDRAVHVSSLSHSRSLPKLEFDTFDSVNSATSFDSFIKGTCITEEAVESEIDDPEEEDDNQIEQDESEKKYLFFGQATYDEQMKLRDELVRLREENEIQNRIIKENDEEKEEIVKMLSGNINELRGFREEMSAIREDSFVVSMKESGDKVSVPFDEVTKLTDEIERLKMENMYQKEQVEEKVEEVVEVTKMFEEAKFVLMNLEQELETINGYFEDALAVKEEEILEVTRQFEATKLKDEQRKERVNLNDVLVGKHEDQTLALGHLNEAAVVREDEIREPITQIINAGTEKELENEAISQTTETDELDEDKNETIECLGEAVTEKDTEKSEVIWCLRDEIIEKDIEKNEVIRQLNKALEEKDEEKREAIRQLSIAMEILREENEHLKKALANISPRKKCSNFQFFNGISLW